ncbi:hypothetical protein HY792_05220 [Candidatus Desantisbacteria bacterium]|nr:hypothetical protein [Candidatus Desantisbacteria bacterium]
MYAQQKIALLAIGLCVVIGCGKKEEKFVRKANPDFKGVIQRFEKYGFSIKLYSEYTKVADKSNAYCFIPENDLNKKFPKNLAILFWNRDEGLYENYSNAVSKPQNSQDVTVLLNLEELGIKDNLVKVYKMNKPGFDLACVLWTREQKLLKKYNRLRLELFPKDKKHQITVVMKGADVDMNKLLDMAESIETFPIKKKPIEQHVHDDTCQHEEQ